MPIRRIAAADAFETMKANPNSDWPRRDDPADRFAHFADPHFEPRFMLEPGQRIFTIGSCFARGIEKALADRGFDIPTLSLKLAEGEWRPGDAAAGILNNYVPPAIAPQIRWAFGMEAFDVDRHAIEVSRGRYMDLQLTLGFRPVSAEALVRRRNFIGEIYRTLASSHVVIITLGLIEAWFDTRSGLYINCPPHKGVVRADPARFELHVLDYSDVMRSLSELIELLDEVCPRDYRMMLTVSPVPLQATFTTSDVAVANSYSKSVLRAAVEPFVAGRSHIEYFPSYESVVLTDRSIAFVDDQVHVQAALIRFNVDRMIARYVRNAEESILGVIQRARAESKTGLFGVGLKRLQQAWLVQAENPELSLALAEAHLKAGNGAGAEVLLLKFLEKRENSAARIMLARHYNEQGRHEEAAMHAEKASELGKARLHSSLQRVVAYYHLERFEEGLALLNRISYPLEHKPLVIYWKACFCERLGRIAEAEEHFRQCNGLAENATYMAGFAALLTAQDRWSEAAEWIDRALLLSPDDRAALRLRVESRQRGLRSAVATLADNRPGLARALQRAVRWSTGLKKRALHALPFGNAATEPKQGRSAPRQ